MDFAKILSKIDSIESKTNLSEAWPGSAEWKKKQPGYNPYDPKGEKRKELELKPYGYRGGSGADTDDEPKASKGTKTKSSKDEKPSKKSTKKAVKENESNEDYDQVDEADVEEGNEFSGALAQAKAQGKTEFKVGGKTYKVKESFDYGIDEADEKDNKKDQDGEDKSGQDADAKDEPKDSEGEKDDRSKIDSDVIMYRYLLGGNANYVLIKSFLDHVNRGETIPGPMVKEFAPVIQMIDNIVRSGPAAIHYIRMAQKSAGGNNLAEDKELDQHSEIVECYDQAMMQDQQQSGMNISSNLDTKTGNQSLTVTAQGSAADQLAQILKLSGLVSGGPGPSAMEADIEIGEDYANEPDPVIQGISAQLQQGNDLNRPKKTYPKVAGGDNPMQAVATVSEERDIKIIEKKLTKMMEELSSIKVVNKNK